MKRDVNNIVIPYNEPQIQENTRLFRGVTKHHLVKGEDGTYQVSSAILNPSSKDRDPYEGLSVDVEQKMIEDAVVPEDTFQARLEQECFVGVLSFTVSSFRTKSFLVGYEPVHNNQYHGAVWQTDQAKFTRSTRKLLLNESSWLIDFKKEPV